MVGMRSRRTIHIAVAAVLTLATAFPAGDRARIYVYARRDTAARSWLPISCGNAVVAELKQGAFFAINVAPGRYTLSIENGIPVSLDARPDEESFIRLDWNYALD